MLVYGNCQAPSVAQGLAALDDLHEDFRFVCVLNHVPPGMEMPVVPDAWLQNLALLIQQHEERADYPVLVALRQRLPAGVPVVTFPSFFLPCLWPFECVETRPGMPDPAHPWGRYPLGDMIGLELARAGLQGPLAVAAYMDLSARKLPNMQVRLQRDLQRMRGYDRHCDVKLADYVESTFRREHLFWTNGHVSGTGMYVLIEKVAQAIRRFVGGSAQRAQACLAGLHDHGGLGAHQLPIHPLVAEALQLDFWQIDMTYRWESQNWTFFEYIQRYIDHDTDW
ncbi:hypothetical protein KW835_04610 [Acidovorax sp. sic0104]|nr:hypothetical protein [Acidovorax sp. sic0104]